MQKFLCIQRNDPAQLPQYPPTPEETKKIQTAFNSWMEKYKANITNIGGRLERTGRTLTQTGGTTRITDGPFPESKEVIGGFMILAADSYQAAVDIAREFPAGFCAGFSIEIREISDQF